MPEQVVSPYDPQIAKRNRLTLVALLTFVMLLLGVTYSQRDVLHDAMTKDTGAHGKR